MYQNQGWSTSIDEAGARRNNCDSSPPPPAIGVSRKTAVVSAAAAARPTSVATARRPYQERQCTASALRAAQGAASARGSMSQIAAAPTLSSPPASATAKAVQPASGRPRQATTSPCKANKKRDSNGQANIVVAR